MQPLFESSSSWYRGNLHAHTTGSDGEMSPEELARLYKDNGYDFLALTDHGVVTELSHPPEGLLLIPGVEHGIGESHLVALAPERAMLERADLRGPTLRNLADELKRNGADAILAHPYWSGLEVRGIVGVGSVLALEIYNSGCEIEKGTGSALVHWDGMLARGRSIWGVATDDGHRVRDAFGGWVMVGAEELTVPEVLRALREGRFYSSQGPEIRSFTMQGNDVRIECSPARSVIFASLRSKGFRVDAEGRELLTEARAPLDAFAGYVRAEVRDERGRCAWTNPVVLDALQRTGLGNEATPPTPPPPRA